MEGIPISFFIEGGDDPNNPERKKDRDGDLVYLRSLQEKKAQGELFTKDDLKFIYGITPVTEAPDTLYYKQKELQEGRDTTADMLTIFDCTIDQVAKTPEEIGPMTKAYVGDLGPGIFNVLPEDLEYIYGEFPDGRVLKRDIVSRERTSLQLFQEMRSTKISVVPDTLPMLSNKSPNYSEGTMTIVQLRVEDLRLNGEPIPDNVYARALELGLELCPSEAGPLFRMQYRDQPVRDWCYIAMDAIKDKNGKPSIFLLHNSGVNDLFLDYKNMDELNKYPRRDAKWCFVLPKREKETPSAEKSLVN